jgi:hypothetical protein
LGSIAEADRATAFAELERNIIAERIKAGLRTAKLKGHKPGRKIGPKGPIRVYTVASTKGHCNWRDEMKQWLLLLFVLMLLRTPSYEQEINHATTVEQCRADQKLWLAKLEGSGGALDVSFVELNAWGQEMSACGVVDSQFKIQYYNTAAEIQSEDVVRFLAFISRHDLYQRFVTEDKQGKRR